MKTLAISFTVLGLISLAVWAHFRLMDTVDYNCVNGLLYEAPWEYSTPVKGADGQAVSCAVVRLP